MNWKRALLLVAAIVAGSILFIYLWLLRDLPSTDSVDASLRVPSVRIIDRNGRLLYEVLPDDTGRNQPVELEQIPQACIDATLATEDSTFYTNPGVSLRGVARAIWINLRGGDVISGGSTITQQVVRNLLLDTQESAERTLRRKLRESLLAYRLTNQLSKDEILILYLNQTYYGNLSYGIESAAGSYFNKPIEELSIAECALLAGLPQAPSLYDPLTDQEAAKERQLIVLGLMQEQGNITTVQAANASQQPLAYAAERYSIDAPHFVQYVFAEVQRNLTAEELYAGGLDIQTTLDLDYQNAANRIAIRHLERLNQGSSSQPAAGANNAAVVAMNPINGHVLVMLGNPDYFDASNSGAINLAVSPRQPGSTLKPFTYAATFDPTRPAPWTAATMILDVRTAFVSKEGDSYVPVNFDHRYHGPVLVREALASSYNIPAVIALDAVGTDALFDLLAQLGVSTLINRDNYDLSVTLGSGDVRLLELTAAYAALANQGVAVQPQAIIEVRNQQGEVIYRPPTGEAQQVLDPRVVWLLSDILSDNTARTPSFGPNSILQIGRPAAVKTGTTTDFRDNWTVGYTPQLVTGVWVGNADNTPMSNVSGVSGAGPIWHDFMREALAGTPEEWFSQPSGLVQERVCSLSGLQPTEACPHTRLEWFITGTQPTQADSFYVELNGEIYLSLPPQAHEWARAEGLALLPESAERTEASPLILTDPEPATVFNIDATRPLSAQRIRFAAAAQSEIQQVTFYLNRTPYETVTAPFETWWEMSPGTYQIYAEGIHSDGTVIRTPSYGFTVKP